jgi:hypothetical protein
MKKQLADLERARKKALRDLDRQYRRQRRELQKIGALQKRKSNKELTKSQKRLIRRRFREFEEFLTGDHYIFVPIRARKKGRRKKALDLARQNQLPVAPRGLFIERTPEIRKARTRFDKKTGEYKLIVEKVRRGKGGQRETTEIIPLKPMGDLASELARIKADAASLGPLKKDERLAFSTYVNDLEGYSHNVYSDPETLINDIAERYGDMKTLFKGQFFRSITVAKTRTKTWLRDHPAPQGNVYARTNRKGRSRAIKKHKAKVTVKRVGDNWGVYIGAHLDSEWAARGQALEEARRLRQVL